MNHDLPWLEEELAAHSQWVRRLARSLVHDESAAEDLVQDTWVAALRRPPAERRALRSWLARVVRTLAWKQQRRAANAPTSGIDEQLPGGAPGTELVERLELHRVLAEELRSIREPLRTTLLQRYFEGRSAAEIAQREGVPAPTVRWRLQQGLEELRAHLDARFGGKRETWMSALAFALPAKGAVLGGSGAALAGSGTAIGEGVLMSTLMKISLGAVALVAAVMLALPFVKRDELPVEVPALANSPSSHLEGDPDSTRSKQEALAAESTEAERASIIASSKPASAVDSGTRVLARFLDSSRRPISGAWIRHVNTRREHAFLDGEELAVSGTDGRATMRPTKDDRLSGVRLAVGASGYATVFLYVTAQADQATDLGDFVLQPGGDVRGTVVDRENRPIEHALVLAAPEPETAGGGGIDVLRARGPQRMGTTLACESTSNGGFLLQGVPAGTTRVWARYEDYRWALSAPIVINAGSETAGIVLLVDADEAADPALADVRGVVLDPEGRPVANPHLDVIHRRNNDSHQEQLVGGTDGSFRIHPKSPGATMAIEISAPEDRFTHAVLDGVLPGTKDLVVRLETAKTLVLVVTDEHGPVERFNVRAGDEMNPQGRTLLADEPRAEGRATVRVPSESTWYHVEAPAHAPTKLGPIDGRTPPAELAVVLRTVACVRGRVMAGDQPVAGAKISLCEQNESAGRISGGFRSYVDTFDAQKTTSAEDGSFVIGIVADGNYSLFADAAGFARGRYGPVLLSTESAPAEIVIPVDGGGALEGKVLMPPGLSPAGVIVGVNCGDGKPLKQTVSTDGMFRFERLTPGSWELKRAPDPLASMTYTMSGGGPESTSSIRLKEDLVIVVGQTTRMDLDLRAPRTSVLEVDLRNNSVPARGWSVRLRPKANTMFEGPPPRATTDEDGHARLESPFDGECELALTPPVEASSTFHMRADVALKAGTTAWSRNVETGRIEGLLTDWKADAGVEWKIAGGKEVFPLVLRPDAEGRFVEPFVLSGSILIQRGIVDDYTKPPDTLRTLELATGQVLKLQLP